MSLVFALSLPELADWVKIILEVGVGLGMVIFVHELGHFAVAKACGVKCEKFYLGFDIYGLKLFHRQWGETEYGIGILPLGGYVKMLGQDDNPGKAAEERERSTIAGEAGVAAIDPRSYMAQSVPKRMAIISAGVIMNVIFTFVLASVAYEIGVREIPCVVGSVWPGEAAWRAGLRTGDRVVQIGELKNPRFRDLQQGVLLGSSRHQGVKFVIQRPGVKETFTRDILPDFSRGAPMIGVTSPSSTLLRTPPLYPAWNKSLEDQLHPGDEVTAVDGKPVTTFAEIKEALTLEQFQPIALTLAEKPKPGSAAPQSREVRIPPRPIKGLGLAMEIGPVTALQFDSPAKNAGVQVGDKLLKIDGQPIGDPLRLPATLAKKAGQAVVLTLKRDGKPLELSVEQRKNYIYEQPYVEEDPLPLSSLGLACSVTNRVASVGPELQDQVKPGDKVASVRAVPPQAAIDAKLARVVKMDLSEKPGWSTFFFILQDTLDGTKVELTLEGGKTVSIEPKAVPDWFNPDRGLDFDAESYLRTAQSLPDDLALARRETRESVTQVFGFLNKLRTGDISVKNMAGPPTIAAMAGRAASEGISSLLMFLAMLSANLAVLNFLPIPLLDGGHMAFLIIEGIRGKPVSERIVLAFHYAGFVFIIGLMLFVFSLEIQRGLSWLELFQ